jgi:hypothetical protein
VTEPNDHDAMLKRVIAEALEALQAADGQDRAKIIANQLQVTTGWALRWAVEDLRNSGMSWQAISLLLQRPHQVLLRQMQVKGPLYLHRPAYSENSRNFDGQTPIRRAALQLADRMAGLWWENPESATHRLLWPAVQALSRGQAVAPDPGPMLAAARELIEIADQTPASAVRLQAELSDAERSVWDAIDELRACYHRDQDEMTIAHHVLTEVALVPARRGR